MEDERLTLTVPKHMPEQVFIRFGKWARNMRSINHVTGERERGLSVYNARIEPDGTISLIADDYSMKAGVTAEACASSLSGRLCFVVTGKVVGQGSDGEPVLTGVRLLPYAIRPQSIPEPARDCRHTSFVLDSFSC